MRFRFVHAADLHLDTPFTGLRPVPPAVGDRLRDASLEALTALVDLAVDRRVDFLILAGGLYDGAGRGIRAQVAFRRGLERLTSEGIAVFLVHGRAEPDSIGWSAIGSWPELVTVCEPGEVRSVPVQRDGELLATVHGISAGDGRQSKDLVRRFRAPGTPGFHIGVLHGVVTGGEVPSQDGDCTVSDLAPVGMHYWALGSQHQRQVLRHGQPWVAYPGTPQGRSLDPSEQGAKGALVVEVDDHGSVQAPEFVALDRVRLAEVEVNVDGHRDLIDVRQALQGAADEPARAAGGRPTVVCGTLRGTGPVADDLRADGALRELVQQLRDEAHPQAPLVWWDRIHDATHPDLDLEGLRERSDFPAEVVRMAGELAADPERLRAFASLHLAALHTSALAGVREEIPDPTVADRWQQTVELTLALLATVEP